MAVSDQILSRLRRTMQSIFGIGNINIKDSGGIVQTRNAADSAFADIAVNKLRIQGGNASNAVIFNVNTLGSSTTYVLPDADGASGQVLSTNGTGTLSWASASVGGVGLQTESFTEATSSPLTIFTAEANSDITRVTVRVSSAASGGTPTIQIGITGDADYLMTTADVDLKTTGEYIVQPNLDVGGSNIAVIATITPDSQTFSGQIFIEYGIAQ